ncbi:hypothetical protein MKW92_009156, partial [Papaver armeniacum]
MDINKLIIWNAECDMDWVRGRIQCSCYGFTWTELMSLMSAVEISLKKTGLMLADQMVNIIDIRLAKRYRDPEKNQVGVVLPRRFLKHRGDDLYI